MWKLLLLYTLQRTEHSVKGLLILVLFLRTSEKGIRPSIVPVIGKTPLIPAPNVKIQNYRRNSAEASETGKLHLLPLFPAKLSCPLHGDGR